MSYGIRFENQATATAAAQVVRVLDTLDRTKYDLSTFQLNYFNFGDRYIYIPPGLKKRVEEVDLRPRLNLILRIQANLNDSTGILETTYTSLDPITRQLTDDAILGFLPPNKNAPEGEGSVFYTVNVKPELPNKTVINNRAFIYFDTNPVIPTPIWSNTLDKLAPDSKIDALPTVINDTTFTVKWQGKDGESGIRNYNVYFATNGNPYKPLRTNTTLTSMQFTGKMDSTYRFYSVAVDSVRNFELAPTEFDAKTTISRVLATEPALGEEIIIYPNPTAGNFTIKTSAALQIQKITITDVSGRTQKGIYNRVSSNEYQIQIGHLTDAIYLIQLKTSGGSVTKRIQLKR